jgi:hypothetical protein
MCRAKCDPTIRAVAMMAVAILETCYTIVDLQCNSASKCKVTRVSLGFLELIGNFGRRCGVGCGKLKMVEKYLLLQRSVQAAFLERERPVLLVT